MTSGSANRRPPLSLDRIVTETLGLIDEQGIPAVSMRTVAGRLGVRAMSLYRHVENREQLFDEVVERIVNELGDDPQVPTSAVGIGWRRYLNGLAWGVRRYGRAHPHAFPLVATRPPAAPWVNPPLRSLRWIEAMLDNLAAAGFDDAQLLFTYRSFNSFLLGYLLLETSAMAGAHTPAEVIDVLGDVSQPDYPAIHRLHAGLTDDRFEAEFAAGLELLLDRIEAALGTG